MPISTIISGRFLAQLFKMPGERKQLFQVKIPQLITISAEDDEVIFGFSLFLSTLLATALINGSGAYSLFKSDFGLDIGQFNSITVLSAIFAMLLAILLRIITHSFGALRRRTDTIGAERDRLIEELASEQTGKTS